MTAMKWIDDRMPPKYMDVLIRFPGKNAKSPRRYTVGYHDGVRWIVQNRSVRKDTEIAWVQIEDD